MRCCDGGERRSTDRLLVQVSAACVSWRHSIDRARGPPLLRSSSSLARAVRRTAAAGVVACVWRRRRRRGCCCRRYGSCAWRCSSAQQRGSVLQRCAALRALWRPGARAAPSRPARAPADARLWATGGRLTSTRSARCDGAAGSGATSRQRTLGLGYGAPSHAHARVHVFAHGAHLRGAASRARRRHAAQGTVPIPRPPCSLARDSHTSTPHASLLSFCASPTCSRSQLLEQSDDCFLIGCGEEVEFESAATPRLLGFSMLGCVPSWRSRYACAPSL